MKRDIEFLFEVGQLKRVKRSGWWVLGITNPESVAEHCFRTSILGYIIAQKEKVDSDIVLKMCLFHDLHETRINDLHKVGAKYIGTSDAEKIVEKDQFEGLEYGEHILNILDEASAKKSPEAIVARDADLLECALQAREYIVQGYKDAQNWIDNVESVLETSSAKKMLEEIKKADPNFWWKGLKKIKR